MTGIVAKPEGITYPPIDDLMEKVDSKYALVVYAARRARQARRPIHASAANAAAVSASAHHASASSPATRGLARCPPQVMPCSE